MDWISNRELAVAIWVLLVIALSVVKPRLRAPMINLLRSMANRYFLMSVAGAVISTLLALKIFEPAGGWTDRQIWLSCIWFITVGIPMIFRVVNDAPEASWCVVAKAIGGAFTITAVLEFLVNYKSFAIAVELMLIPAIFIFTLIGSRTVFEEKDRGAIALSQWMMTLLGAVIVVALLASVVFEPEKLLQREIAVDFAVPLIHTAFYTLYIGILFIYVCYQSALSRIYFFIQDEDLEKYAKRAGATSFGLNVRSLKHWLDVLSTTRPTTRIEVEESLRVAYLLK